MISLSRALTSRTAKCERFVCSDVCSDEEEEEVREKEMWSSMTQKVTHTTDSSMECYKNNIEVKSYLFSSFISQFRVLEVFRKKGSGSEATQPRWSWIQ